MRALLLAVVFASTTALAAPPLQLVRTSPKPTGFVPKLYGGAALATTLITPRAYDFVDTDDVHTGVALTVGYSFTLKRAFLDVELGFTTGGTRSAVHSSLSTDFAWRAVEAGVGYRYALFKHLHPYAKLLGGVDIATLTIVSTERLTQTVVGGAGQALVGVQVPVYFERPTDTASIVLDAALGAGLHSGLAFDKLGPTPPQKPAADAIPRGSTSIGSLSLSGFTFRVGLLVRL